MATKKESIMFNALCNVIKEQHRFAVDQAAMANSDYSIDDLECYIDDLIDALESVFIDDEDAKGGDDA